MNFLFSDDDDEGKGFPLFLIFLLLLPIATILAVFLIEERTEEESARGTRGRREREEPRRERERQASSGFQAVTDRTTQRQEQRETQKQPETKPQKETEKTPAARSRQQTRGGEDKLEVIEGIGPKTAGILRNAGITTLRQLADTSVERLNEILTEAGLRLNPPDSWPEQARYAADGDWDGLDELKSRLHAGRA